MIWKKADELPLDKCGMKKVLVLAKGKISGDTLYPCTASWLVQKTDNFITKNTSDVLANDSGYYGKLKIGNGYYAIDKIVAWCDGSEIVNDYLKK